MVKVYGKDGTVLFEEPPYTKEEERDFYRRVGGGPKAVLHAPRPDPKAPPPTPPPVRRPGRNSRPAPSDQLAWCCESTESRGGSRLIQGVPVVG
jgi:hypothetical protein